MTWLSVILLSAIPISEYQAAVPLGIAVYHMPAWAVALLAVLGSMLPFFPLFFGLSLIREWLSSRFPKLVKPLDALLARGERALKDDYAKYGAAALFLALVVPFPFTGVWTTTFAAVALKIPFKAAFFGILLGVIGGVTLFTLGTLGLVKIF